MTKFLVACLTLVGSIQALTATPLLITPASNPELAPPTPPLRVEADVQSYMQNYTYGHVDGEDLCQCGQSTLQSTRIVGGTYANAGEFPWRVKVFSGNWNGGMGCGATVLSSRWLLTAAHCFGNMQPGDFIMVQPGELDYNKARMIMNNRRIDHEDYNKTGNMEHDISLIELSEELDMSNPKKISPVCLPYQYIGNSEIAGKVVASGWGRIESGVNAPNTRLRKVGLQMLGTTECQKEHYRHRIDREEVTTYQTCTAGGSGNTCQGDSGGSIDMLVNGRYTAMGVVSYGHGCRQDVFTRVSEYIGWIEEKTGNRNFCQS